MCVEGNRGTGSREKGGGGRCTGSEIPKMARSGRDRGNYATLPNLSQLKMHKDAGANNSRAGTGVKGYGKREVETPLSPPIP